MFKRPFLHKVSLFYCYYKDCVSNLLLILFGIFYLLYFPSENDVYNKMDII